MLENTSTAYKVATSQTIQRLTAAGTAIGVAAVTGSVAYFDPSTSHFFPVCPLYSLTGFACPGCGLTRGFHALFHGDVTHALGFNLLSPVWAVIFAYLWISLVVTAVRGKGLPMWMADPRFLWTFMFILIVFGILRNLPVYPFSLLFPG
jgi:hypothetical protein